MLRKQSAKIAFCGMMAALSAVIMLLGGVIPIATYAVPMLCGLLLLPIFIEFGEAAAWTTFAAVALLALILGFDKEAAFFYLFIGYYPILKWRIDKLPSKAGRYAVKLLLFTLSMTVMYLLLDLLFPTSAFLKEFEEMGIILSILFLAVYGLSMLLYDRLLMPCTVLYANRIRPRLKFLLRNG